MSYNDVQDLYCNITFTLTSTKWLYLSLLSLRPVSPSLEEYVTSFPILWKKTQVVNNLINSQVQDRISQVSLQQKWFWYISYTFTTLSYHEDGSVKLFISSYCMLWHHKQNEGVASNLFGDSINGEMDLGYRPWINKANSLKPFQQYRGPTIQRSNNTEVPVTDNHLLLSPWITLTKLPKQFLQVFLGTVVGKIPHKQPPRL